MDTDSLLPFSGCLHDYHQTQIKSVGWMLLWDVTLQWLQQGWNQSDGWGFCNEMWMIISPEHPRLLWHLPGIPQGTSHCRASLLPPSPVKPHMSSLFFCVTQTFLQPPFHLLLPSFPPPSAFSKRSKRNKDEVLKALRNLGIKKKSSPILCFLFLLHKGWKCTQLPTLNGYWTAFNHHQPLSSFLDKW